MQPGGPRLETRGIQYTFSLCIQSEKLQISAEKIELFNSCSFVGTQHSVSDLN
jgi:hypothetical protein